MDGVSSAAELEHRHNCRKFTAYSFGVALKRGSCWFEFEGKPYQGLKDETLTPRSCI